MRRRRVGGSRAGGLAHRPGHHDLGCRHRSRRRHRPAHCVRRRGRLARRDRRRLRRRRCAGDPRRGAGGVGAREYVVIAGRATLPGGPLGEGAARGALLAGLESTLERLGTDHLDLWQLPAWDATVPLDETLSAVQVAVLSGRARYAGLVAPTGWQLATVAERGRALGAITVPVSAQVEYSLLARDAEAELLPAALHHGVGLLAWAPLGRGVLTGRYAGGTPADSRGASATLAACVQARRTERSARIVQSVLTASMAAESVTLPAEVRAALDDVSAPG